jgi:hypothetical protein
VLGAAVLTPARIRVLASWQDAALQPRAGPATLTPHREITAVQIGGSGVDGHQLPSGCRGHDDALPAAGHRARERAAGHDGDPAPVRASSISSVHVGHGAARVQPEQEIRSGTGIRRASHRPRSSVSTYSGWRRAIRLVLVGWLPA